MQRYMVNNKNLNLEKSDINHIINVMRMKVSEKFKIVYDKTLYTCMITNISHNNVSFEVIKKDNMNKDKKHRIIIAVSIIKEKNMDVVLQKATELGVDEIIPLITERTVVKVNDKKDNKLVRWNKIIKEASEQSHRYEMPILHDIIELKNINMFDYSLKILCNTKEKEENIKKVLQDHTKSDTIILVVGPEGGFADKEVLFLEKNGFISTRICQNILRAETVPLYLLSVLNYEFME